jgi:hypothetical protein
MRSSRSTGRSARFLVVALILATFLPALASAHDDDLVPSIRRGVEASGEGTLDGTWRLVSPPLGGGREEYKTIGGGRFIWYVVVDGRIVGSAGGRASRHGKHYVERIDFVGSDEVRWMVGGTGHFTVGRRHRRWLHRGTVMAADGGMSAGVEEEWERVR